MHPDRSKFVRASLIEVVKKMDPLDALVLETLEVHPRVTPDAAAGLAAMRFFLERRGHGRHHTEGLNT
jgi:hypothetical protein